MLQSSYFRKLNKALILVTNKSIFLGSIASTLSAFIMHSSNLNKLNKALLLNYNASIFLGSVTSTLSAIIMHL